jgi:serine O-acetyltransferase
MSRIDATGVGLRKLVRSDLDAHYCERNVRWRFARGIMNPSVRACGWIRLVTRGPWPLRSLARRRLIAGYSSDVAHAATIGPGLNLPHPIGIVVGGGVRLGRNVTIYHHVTLGAHHGAYPAVGDGVVIYPGSVIVGGVEIGDRATVGANCFVAHDVGAGDRVPGGARQLP